MESQLGAVERERPPDDLTAHGVQLLYDPAPGVRLPQGRICGVDVGGGRYSSRQAGLVPQLVHGILVGRYAILGRDTELGRDGDDQALGVRSRCFPGAQGSARRVGSDHKAIPSVRHTTAICQRGNTSPGYHFPCPW